MIKESILFVASTGLLLYFIAPADKAPEAEAVKEQVQKPVKRSVKPADDGWGYDEDEGDGEESFTFGEPMTLLDDDSADDSVEEEGTAGGQEQTANSVPPSSRSPSSERDRAKARYAPGSPRSGEPGSLENPIVFKTNNPPNPADD
jgi:hypothetical protein